MLAEKKWLFTLFSAAFVSLLLFLSSISGFNASYALSFHKPFSSTVHHGLHYPPAFAYYISGGRGHKDRILRLLLAVYHPRNRYLLHLGADASDEERRLLASAVKSVPAIRAFGNVDVVGKPDRLTYMGSSNIAATLRAASILLRVDSGWNWFITLSSMDYPLITQDGALKESLGTRLWWMQSAPRGLRTHGEFKGLDHGRLDSKAYGAGVLFFSHLTPSLSPLSPPSSLKFGSSSSGRFTDATSATSDAGDQKLCGCSYLSHVFSSVRRDLNFIDHTSDLGWKESQRVHPIVVDPGIYLARRSQIFHATEKRPTPDGSPWVILNRSFLEFCILGWDNLPRTLLMYFTNVILSDEGYFHSVICNSPEFRNTTVNNDLRYVIWDSPPKMEPHFLNVSDYDQTVQSGAAFARQFQKDDPVLNMIDEKILKRGRNRVVPGAWCTGRKSWWMDPCSNWGDANVLRPGLQAKKLEESVTNLLEGSNSQSNQCK
ncbi:Beta-glucuronosyltransferase GlcAT14A [Vitis vinifera]|uniref:Beta-glucuronosyltransferase GlcAT14A n=1 Tax=Vitis vinifera TaxID=29760 RepID=A0A438C119_VITVI|nr:Beta-glucuronosyltransferase GlcAT14A [Vitis vinifera]